MAPFPFEKYLLVFSLLFLSNTAFLFILCFFTLKKKPDWFKIGFILASIISLTTFFFTFRYHFELYSERTIQLYLPAMFSMLSCVAVLSVCGYITDRKTSWSLNNGIVLLPLSLVLVFGGFELAQTRFFFWVWETPGILLSTLIIFFWLFLVIGFFEILSSSDWLFIVMMIFYNLTLKVLFYYMDFPPVLLNDFMLMAGIILMLCKLFFPFIRIGSTISIPLGLIQALIPVITRLKRFTFVTFISPFFLITMIIIILFINFYWRSLLFRGPKKV